jgi:rubrerythrin
MNIDLDGFDRVGSRVTKPGEGRAPSREEDIKLLRRFMDDKAENAEIYGHLAHRTTSPASKRIFRSLRGDELRHLKTLRSAYYLLTGDSFRPSGQKPVRGGALTLIRSMYNRETKSAEAFRRAGQETKIPNLARIFKSISEDDGRHAVILERMIRRLMD